MIAAVGLDYKQAHDLLARIATDPNPVGRKMAHAMAHGFYACRSYVVLYNESAGTFGVIHDPR